jgi:hypothetical protein
MTKLFFLIIFLLVGPYSLKAAETPASSHEFMNELNSIKDPFEEGFPKPIPVVVQMPINVNHKGPKKPINVTPPKPKASVGPVITLPTLDLQGVLVGEDMHEAIIDDKIVPLQGSIKGAKVISVSKQGVGLLYKGKKFLLKVD